jgi:hypothetical protein
MARTGVARVKLWECFGNKLPADDIMDIISDLIKSINISSFSGKYAVQVT